MMVYHGSPESFDTFDRSCSQDRNTVTLGWFATDPRHAAAYGNVERWEIAPARVLDLRDITPLDPSTRRPVERDVPEWVAMLRAKGLDVQIDPTWEQRTGGSLTDNPVPLWDLLAGHDAGTDTATNLADILAVSEYDAMRAHEMGVAPDWTPSDTIAVLRDEAIVGKVE